MISTSMLFLICLGACLLAAVSVIFGFWFIIGCSMKKLIDNMFKEIPEDEYWKYDVPGHIYFEDKPQEKANNQPQLLQE